MKPQQFGLLPDAPDEFETFWAAYPRHVARLAAEKAFARARGKASLETLLAGVARYREQMPADPRFQAHPATWLNAGRWMDEDLRGGAPMRKGGEDWFDECKRLHDGACGLSRWTHHTRKILDAGRR